MLSRDRNLISPLECEPRQPAASAARGRNQATICVVHSNHPLALRTIKNAIACEPGLRDCIKTYSNNASTSTPKNSEILVIDICSVGSWQELLEKWQSDGGRTIALVSADSQNEAEELQLLYLGATGIVPFSDDLIQKLPEVIHAVAQGRLWIRRGVLNEYVRRTNLLLRRLASSDPLFTAREHQIIDFLRRGYSNKQIANLLDISERTVKFHVSNILRKCNMENRRGFLAVTLNSSLNRGPLSLVTEPSAPFSVPKTAALAGGKQATPA